MTEAATRRAEACFRLASHPNTGEGERQAALDRGMGILERHGLDPDDFDIPGRTRPERVTVEVRINVEFDPISTADFFGSIFGTCAGCGAVASVGSVCRACHIKAAALACRHGRHGFCIECEGMPE